MRRLALIAMSAALAVGSAFAAGNADLDIDKVNGSIHVPDNATVGKLSTVKAASTLATAHTLRARPPSTAASISAPAPRSTRWTR